MIIELRIYDLAPGRRQDMSDRMTKDLLRIFTRNGVPLSGAWQAEAGPAMPQFFYTMSHDSMESHNECWGRFYADPDWAETRARTNGPSELVRNGQIIFSAPLPSVESFGCQGDAIDRCDEILFLEISAGCNVQAVDALSTEFAPIVKAHSGGILNAATIAAGSNLPCALVWLSWPDMASRRDGGEAIDNAKFLAAGRNFRQIRRVPLSPLPGLSPVPGLSVLRQVR